jgi:hypothetical protein
MEGRGASRRTLSARTGKRGEKDHPRKRWRLESGWRVIIAAASDREIDIEFLKEELFAQSEDAGHVGLESECVHCRERRRELYRRIMHRKSSVPIGFSEGYPSHNPIGTVYQITFSLTHLNSHWAIVLFRAVVSSFRRSHATL